jgi:hypothetical protein
VRGLILDDSLARDRADPGGRRFFAFADGWKARLEKKRFVLRPRYWSVLGVEAHGGGKIEPKSKSRAQAVRRGRHALTAVGGPPAASLEEQIAELEARW